MFQEWNKHCSFIQILWNIAVAASSLTWPEIAKWTVVCCVVVWVDVTNKRVEEVSSSSRMWDTSNPYCFFFRCIIIMIVIKKLVEKMMQVCQPVDDNDLPSWGSVDEECFLSCLRQWSRVVNSRWKHVHQPVDRLPEVDWSWKQKDTQIQDNLHTLLVQDNQHMLQGIHQLEPQVAKTSLWVLRVFQVWLYWASWPPWVELSYTRPSYCLFRGSESRKLCLQRLRSRR